MQALTVVTWFTGSRGLVDPASSCRTPCPASLYSSAATRKGLFLDIPHPPRRLPTRQNEHQNECHIIHYTPSTIQPHYRRPPDSNSRQNHNAFSRCPRCRSSRHFSLSSSRPGRPGQQGPGIKRPRQQKPGLDVGPAQPARARHRREFLLRYGRPLQQWEQHQRRRRPGQ